MLELTATTAAAAASSSGRRSLQQAASSSRTSTYPTLTAGADPRLSKCGRATINPKHVRKAAGATLSMAGERWGVGKWRVRIERSGGGGV